MNEMIERVARAICRKRAGTPQMGTTRMEEANLDAYVEKNWHWWDNEALAAIEAMREPTQIMAEDGKHDLLFFPCSEEANRQVWQAMIDAALKP